MNKKVPVAITIVAAQLAAYHLSQPDDCKCTEQQVAAIPADVPQQPENLPEVPLPLIERAAAAGPSSTVVSASSTTGYESLQRVSGLSTVSIG
jgi:hypothetical protein